MRIKNLSEKKCAVDDPEALPVFDHSGAVTLGRYLHESGYQHTAVTPLTHQYNLQRAEGSLAKNLRDVLGWNRPFAKEVVSANEFQLLSDAGILIPHGQYWRSHVRWASLEGLLCMHSAYPTDAEDAVFFGPDTYRFARMIGKFMEDNAERVQRLNRAVDIGCGSGAGALLLTQHCPLAQVLAVDINPTALAMTAVNAELAGADRLCVEQSNLLDDVEGAFDLIIANPPYMLDVQERVYRHGGGDLGEGLSSRIVASALDRLAPGGTLLLYTGIAIVEGRDPFFTALERQLAGHPCQWRYETIDPDVFSDELLKPAYANVERIAAVGLTLTKHRR